MFTGQWFDAAIGQYYLRARDYGSALGRLTSRDTSPGQAAYPLTLPGYNYAADDPVNNIDPSGLTTLEEGQAAHIIITQLYRNDHPGSWVLASVKTYSGGDVLLPDIINMTGLDETTGLLAEIKTPGEAALGETQLQGYLALYNSRNVAGKTWIRDYFWSPTVKQFWLGAVNPALANTFGAIIANDNGVIIYTTYTVKQPPPFPLALKAVEEVTESIYSRFRQFQFRPIFVLPQLPPVTSLSFGLASVATAGLTTIVAIVALNSTLGGYAS